LENKILFVHLPVNVPSNSFIDVKTGSISRSKRETEEQKSNICSFVTISKVPDTFARVISTRLKEINSCVNSTTLLPNDSNSYFYNHFTQFCIF